MRKLLRLSKKFYKLFLEGDGQSGPLGIRGIVEWLNARGYRTRKGGAYYVGAVHSILTNETYAGTASFNRKNARTGKLRPREEWIKIAVPKIVSQSVYQRVQILLKDRRPNMTPPRLTSSKVLLSGIAVCEGCGKPLMMATGKGGAYRYYKCSGKYLTGRCAGELAITIREKKLDQLTLDALTNRLLTPQRTLAIVSAVAKKREGARGDANHALNQLRGQLSQTNRRIRNLLEHQAINLDRFVLRDANFLHPEEGL